MNLNLDLKDLDKLKQITNDILKLAKLHGASQAEVVVAKDLGLTTTVRLGEVETLEFHREQSVGISVYFGKRKGLASTSDLTKEAIEETVKAACNIAQYTMPDECAGLAEAELMAYDYPDLQLYYPSTFTAEEAINVAQECEAVARNLDQRITNSEGATVSTHEGMHVYGNSHGFIGGYPSSRYSLSCVMIGEMQGQMQRDYWYSVVRNPLKLESAQKIGQKAAERTIARLGARRIKTGKYPVIYQADAARGLLSHFLQGIQGNNLYRRASFLVDSLGQEVFAPWVKIDEQPHLIGGLASAPFDAEGVRTKPKTIIADGVLESYILGSYSARKLSMHTTGNAGGVHNISIHSNQIDKPATLEALLKKMGTGLLVTELMGQGVNIITGDYSRGVTGFWVENGVIQYPVEEITLAGNLRDMFRNAITMSNDIDTRSGIYTGSWLLSEMTLAGE